VLVTEFSLLLCYSSRCLADSAIPPTRISSEGHCNMSERRATAKAAADKFIVACVAPGTLKGYKKKWVKWLTFAREHGYLLAPPRPSDLEDYLTSEVVARGSVTVIDSISASFNWHCAKVGYDSPFLNNKNCSDREGNEKATSQVK
jgi:hypothetical protein